MLSRYFYHGLNGQLCPEYFQKGPRNFSFFWGEASASQLPRVLFSKILFFLNCFRFFFWIFYFSGHFLFLGIELCAQKNFPCPVRGFPGESPCREPGMGTRSRGISMPGAGHGEHPWKATYGAWPLAHPFRDTETNLCSNTPRDPEGVGG